VECCAFAVFAAICVGVAITVMLLGSDVEKGKRDGLPFPDLSILTGSQKLGVA
jgi:hypothetical protein